MKFVFYLILSLALVGCTSRDENIISEAETLLSSNQVDEALAEINHVYNPENLDEPLKARYAVVVAEAHLRRGEALIEDSLLRDAYSYYCSVVPVDSSKRVHATRLLARYYWWIGEKDKAYSLLENALADFGERSLSLDLNELYWIDKNYAKARENLSIIIEQETDATNKFQQQNNYAVLSYFLNDRKGVENTYEKIINAPQDTTFYYKYTLKNYATMLSSYGNQRDAMKIQNEVLRYNIARNDSVEMAWSYTNMSRFHLLLGNVGEAERYMKLTSDVAEELIKTDMSFACNYMMMRAVLDYTTNKTLNTMEWAEFINDLIWNDQYIDSVTKAKEDSNRALAERNLYLTIERQRGQLVATYIIVALVLVCAVLGLVYRRKKRLMQEKDEELETLRQLIQESQHDSDSKDDRFFKRIMLQQLGVIRMAASNPTTANQELLKRMTEIADKEVAVDALLNWDDLYKTIDYIYDGYYSNVLKRYGSVLNEKEVQLCCLLRANFSTKEISIVTQQGVRTVYQRKTVVRQKLGIEEKGDIPAHLSSLGHGSFI